MGSSPLTRGKPTSGSSAGERERLIPAHAGKTVDRAHARGAVRAHPRSRGENAPSGRRLDRPSGSSPLTRGKRGPSVRRRGPPGLIPAHAGKTWHTTTRAVPAQAHPRSRGENLLIAWSKSAKDGSSPLTRGKLTDYWQDITAPGLIPAHAGKTSIEEIAARMQRAHPRSRGENAYSKCAGDAQSGSSPLTRGKLCVQRRTETFLGLIPAHAGKTISLRSVTTPYTAHPRSRGENQSAVDALR